MIISHDGTTKEGIIERKTQGTTAISQLKSITMMGSKYKKNKHNIQNNILKSITTYISEVRQLNRSTEKNAGSN